MWITFLSALSWLSYKFIQHGSINPILFKKIHRTHTQNIQIKKLGKGKHILKVFFVSNHVNYSAHCCAKLCKFQHIFIID